MPSKTTSKKTTKNRRKRKDRSAKEWAILSSKWAQSGLTLTAFCRQENIAHSTAKRKIKKIDRDELKADIDQRAEEIRKELNDSAVEGQARNQVASLKVSREVLADVLASSAAQFKKTVHYSYKTPEQLGRLIISATQELRAIDSELLGIPTEEDPYVWPVTKNYEPLWYQRDFLFDFPSNLARRNIPAFILAFVAGLGTGKTMTGANKAGILASLNRGLPGYIYAPTYKVLADVTLLEFERACSEKGISYKHYPSKKLFMLFGDTPIYYGSMDKPDTLRGPTLAWGWIDEGLQMPTRYAFDVIMARIRHPEARELCLVFTGTPDGLNWGNDILVDEAKDHKVIRYGANTQDNVILGPEYYQRLLTLYDSKFAKQELFGEFIDVTKGQAYYNFTRNNNVLEDRLIPFEIDLPVILMTDFNVSPMAWAWGQSFPHSGDEVTYVQDELSVDSASTELAMKEFVSRYREMVSGNKPQAGVRVYGDAAGRHRHTSATRTDYQIIEDILKKEKIPYQINIGKANPEQYERVKDVNARLMDALGNVHLIVSDKCENLIKDFVRQGFIPGTRQLDKKDKSIGHWADAVGYYVNKEHAIRRMRARH